MFRDICQLYVYLLPSTSYDATFYVGIMNLSFTGGRITPGGQQKRLDFCFSRRSSRRFILIWYISANLFYFAIQYFT